ncbi:MAG: iron ABC transporter permease [Chitinophagaceae bacterium]|nr:iron ABC transporter permease [Oligoflexus sp.]
MKRDHFSYSTILSICTFAFVFAFLLAWTFGGAALYPWQLFDSDVPEITKHILISIRLPRIACACLVGAALSVAGMLSQGLFRNPLASPSVIGIESGGSFGAILAFYFGLGAYGMWTLPMFAFVGCLLITLLILSLARSSRFAAVEDLLLIGFALSAILSAASSFFLSLSLGDFEKGPAMMNWLLGTLAGRTWDHFLLGLIPIGLGLVASHFVGYQLNILSLGSDVAQTLGVKLKRLRLQTITLSSLLVATSISIGGIMPFLGLVAPHISRLLVGPDHKKLLAVSALNGMTLLLLADLVARTIIAPSELQVGVLIAMVGSPFFLFMLYHQRRSFSS